MEFPSFPDKIYDFILADPPWKYANWSDKKHGAARSWYDCLTVEELCELPVGDLAEKNCALFMWITGPKLIEGSHLKIMEAWGFRPVTIGWVWTKTTRAGKPYMGLGFYTRQATEYCLIGLRGRFDRQSTRVMQAITSPRRAHSQKPDDFHLRIEELFGKRRGIELFARSEPKCSDAWDVWGTLEGVGKEGHNPKWTDSLSDSRKETYAEK